MLEDAFLYDDSSDNPVIISIDPAEGHVDGGTLVTISGMQFTELNPGETKRCMRRKMVEQVPDSESAKSVKAKKAKATVAKKKHSKIAKTWYKSQLAAFVPKAEEADEEEE